MLHAENARSLATFIFEDILCRWGAIEELVTDNGPAFVQAAEHLATKYKINHIKISPYNSQANGIVERRHLDVREALVKASEGEEQQWTTAAPAVFWAERVSIQKSTGYSPYYIAHGLEPLLPFDLAEATYLTPSLTKPLTTEDLIVAHALQLRKQPQDLMQVKEAVLKAWHTSIREFNKKYENVIQDFKFDPGSLVLIRNSRHDKDLGSKMAPRYFGPMIVLKRTTGGSYILSELDGSILKLRFAAFRIVPYHPRDLRAVPVTKITDATPEQLDNYTYDVDSSNLGLPDALQPQTSPPSPTTCPIIAPSLVQLNSTPEDQPSHKELPARPAGPR
jgi:hypothetical protein